MGSAKGGDMSNRFYSKVYAAFHCSRDNCNRAWNSAHGWSRDDEGTICEVCDTKAGLVNAVDEMLKLDTYRCPNQSCKSDWQAIHDGNRTPQQCECESMVFPEPSPQERFGRHYFFKCQNDNCAEKPEWEDFSMGEQKTQRCSTCGSRGDIRAIQKLKPRPWGMIKRMKANKLARGIEGFEPEERPSTHNSTYCDMCQDIIRQGKGRSCHKYRKIVSQLTEDGSGSFYEKIVHAG